ncbi:MAG: serine hydrolase [Gammaproteobacteria bacterium]|nr:serine hydrolase [Gammaproteobacteria bacterium]
MRFILVLAVFLSLATGAPRLHAALPLADSAIESFMDGVVGAEIARGGAIGATVALVQDGRVVFAKGYGMADREQHARVIGDRTLFRIGSVSKLFVWVAVMQQVSPADWICMRT